MRDANPGALGHVNVGTAFHRVAKFCSQSRRGSQPQDLVLILALVESKVKEFDSRNIANVMWSFAKL